MTSGLFSALIINVKSSTVGYNDACLMVRRLAVEVAWGSYRWRFGRLYYLLSRP